MNRAGSATRDADRTALRIAADRSLAGQPDGGLVLLATLGAAEPGGAHLRRRPVRGAQRTGHLVAVLSPVLRPANRSRISAAHSARIALPAWVPAALKTMQGGEWICPATFPASCPTGNETMLALIVR